MDIYDCTANAFITHAQLSKNYHSYNYFHRGQQIHPSNYNQLISIIANAPSKSVLVVSKIQKQQIQKSTVAKALSHHELANHLTPPQLEMIKMHPQSLFQNKLFNFKYAMQKQGTQVSKERQEGIRVQLINGDSGWKQATLQQLQAISKKYDRILQQSPQ